VGRFIVQSTFKLLGERAADYGLHRLQHQVESLVEMACLLTTSEIRRLVIWVRQLSTAGLATHWPACGRRSLTPIKRTLRYGNWSAPNWQVTVGA